MQLNTFDYYDFTSQKSMTEPFENTCKHMIWYNRLIIHSS